MFISFRPVFPCSVEEGSFLQDQINTSLCDGADIELPSKYELFLDYIF